MMTEFDPYEALIKCENQITLLRTNILEIARAFNERSEDLAKTIQALNHNTNIMNDQEAAISNLHDRVRLLEAVRQNESKN